MLQKTLIIGAGGHAKVIAEILTLQGINIMGFLDDNPAFEGTSVLDLPVLGKIAEWHNLKPSGLIMAIGDNQTRKTIVKALSSSADGLWINAIHPRAIISSSAQIGIGTAIMAGAIINALAKIGDHVIINTGASIDHDCKIGDFVHIAPGVHIAGGVRIRDNALLGIGCTVLPNCTIGEGTVIGAGATVISDIPDGVIAKGIPAIWAN